MINVIRIYQFELMEQGLQSRYNRTPSLLSTPKNSIINTKKDSNAKKTHKL